MLDNSLRFRFVSNPNQQFLKQIFGEFWQDVIVTDRNPNVSPPRVGSVWTAGEGVPEDPSADNYFSISTFARAKNGTTRLSKELFYACHLLVMDGVGRLIAPKTILARMGRPSYQIATSPGWAQWGYTLSQPERHAARINALVEGMAARGVPQNVINPGKVGVLRLVRLPVGTNTGATHGL